jgi:hypothetical protein
MSAHSDRSEYQPLRSSEDDADGEHNDPSGSHPHRHGLRPGSIDLTKLDNAFKRLVPDALDCLGMTDHVRWTESIAQKVKRKKKTAETRARKHIWRSVFDPPVTGLSSSGFVCSSLDVGNDATDTACSI